MATSIPNMAARPLWCIKPLGAGFNPDVRHSLAHSVTEKAKVHNMPEAGNWVFGLDNRWTQDYLSNRRRKRGIKTARVELFAPSLSIALRKRNYLPRIEKGVIKLIAKTQTAADFFFWNERREL